MPSRSFSIGLRLSSISTRQLSFSIGLQSQFHISPSALFSGVFRQSSHPVCYRSECQFSQPFDSSWHLVRPAYLYTKPNLHPSSIESSTITQSLSNSPQGFQLQDSTLDTSFVTAVARTPKTGSVPGSSTGTWTGNTGAAHPSYPCSPT